ncbi:MAG: N-formylglutamate amidohydrolase [Albidovulum sp.]|nr:N-formylglutamate amidohydrolase [Albidovulum sp.]MDE0307233.1 N-formylglutamate amidohydrolase [Albidovulum sp.]MDE0531961.1 N-formylglutamate amidohydrolase [Albidovulum sp.]
MPVRANPYETLCPGQKSGTVIVCDHASNEVPSEVGNGSLGLPPEEMRRHIAYDIGAAGVAAGLSRLLGAPAFLSKFSRLVIDANRDESDPTLIMQISDGTIIPANRNLTRSERERRLASYHRPYHDGLESLLSEIADPVLVSVHSFAPRLKGFKIRPWHVGVLFGRDDRVAKPLVELLKLEKGICVGVNQPYSGQLPGDTLNRHAAQKGRRHVLLEIRSDEIATEEGQEKWAERFAPLIQRATR